MTTATPSATSPATSPAIFDDVGIELLQRPAAQSGIITRDGKQFKLEMLVDGVWKEIDASKIGTKDLEFVMQKCQKMYGKIITDGKPFQSLTVYFQYNTLPESWTSSTLGGLIPYFKTKEEQLFNIEFKKLEYKTEGSAEVHVLDVKTHKFEEDVLLALNKSAKKIAPLAKLIFSHVEQLIKDDRIALPQPKPAPAPKSPLAESIKQAGSTNNRCASLSLAKRELELTKFNPQPIVDKYKLALGLVEKINKASKEEDKITLLSEALIEKAADKITQNEEFKDPHIQSRRQPCLYAIEEALEGYKKSKPDFDIPLTPDKKIAKYVSLMVEPNFMLDLPFFLALEEPFIIIQEVNNGYMTTVIGHQYTITDTIEKCDLDDVNIVYFNGKNHYQSVILSTDEQKAEMRKLIRKEIDGQIDEVVNLLARKDLGVEGLKVETTSMLALIALYPEATEELIEKLKTRYPKRIDNFNGVLVGSSDNDFAKKLRNAIHHDPIINEAL